MGVDDRVKKRGGGRRGRGSSLAGMIDRKASRKPTGFSPWVVHLDMFADGTTYDDNENALDSCDFSMLF